MNQCKSRYLKRRLTWKSKNVDLEKIWKNEGQCVVSYLVGHAPFLYTQRFERRVLYPGKIHLVYEHDLFL
jgi:hypothetical protein